MKINRYIPIIFFAISTTILSCAVKNKEIDNKIIKVMSYNIHIASPPSIKPDFSFTDLDAIADVINREKPDLVGLQEVDKFTIRSGKQSHQAKDLGEKTGMFYHFADAVDRSDGVQGVAILSKYPIKKVESIKLPVPEGAKGETRSIALAIVEIAGKEVLFASTHLDHLSDDTRSFQIDQILKELNKHKNLPIIFTGDLNMKPENIVFNKFTDYLETSENKLPTHPSVKPKNIIDYILFNKVFFKHFSVERFYTVDEKYASDHLPLVADIKIK